MARKHEHQGRRLGARRWRAYARLFDGSRGLLAASVAISILQSALLLPVALLVRHVFDRQIPDGDSGGVALSGAIILALYLASTALALVTRWVVLRVTKAAITRLRIQLVERLYSLSRAYHDDHSAGLLHSIVVQDSERVDVMSTALVALLLPALMVSLGLCAIALVLNPLLFAALVTVIPALVVVQWALGRRYRGRTRGWQRAFDAFTADTALALRAMTLTKVHGAERLEVERQARTVSRLGSAGREMAWLGNVYVQVQQSVAASAGVVVLVVGGWATARGSMTLGDLLAFYAIVALLLRQLSLVLSTVPMVLAGYESVARLDDLLETDDREPYAGERRIEFRGSLTLDDVSFSYGREPVLRDLSLTIDAGEALAVVGPNGAGKSTLVSLLLGLYRPQSGRLLADGVPFDELDLRALRRSMGVVLQDPVIFPGTIAENIAYGRPEATEAEIREAARWATADEFVSSLPNGYDTEAGDEGGLLSGGQRQRIAIARALIARPVLLILDEPSTHLDDRAIAALMAGLRELPGAPTLLMISHDAAVSRRADRIVALRDGRVVSDSAVEAVVAP